MRGTATQTAFLPARGVKLPSSVPVGNYRCKSTEIAFKYEEDLKYEDDLNLKTISNIKMT